VNARVQRKKVRKILVKHWRLFGLVLVLLVVAVVTFYRGLEKSRRFENAQKRGPEATMDALFESGFSGDMSAIFVASESPDTVLAPFRQAFRAQFPSHLPGS